MLQNKVFLLIALIVVFVSGALLYVYNPDPTQYGESEKEPVACTMEAKLCPDGSYVGRSGPKCEFAACPSINNNTNLTGSSTNSCSGGVCSPSTTTQEMIDAKAKTEVQLQR